MRVKVPAEQGVVNARRKEFLAVHESHPAASEDRNIISSCSMMRSAKEVIFYEKIRRFVHRFLP